MDGREFDLLPCLDKRRADCGLRGRESQRWSVMLAKLAGAPGRTVMLMREVGSGGYGQQYG
jgi:hypothetical protein